jgi:protein-arginine kinase activator protein McsA
MTKLYLWSLLADNPEQKIVNLDSFNYYICNVCAGTSKTVASAKDIKELQNNIMVMVMQLMDFGPTRNESIEILEELMQILSNSEERFNIMD